MGSTATGLGEGGIEAVGSGVGVSSIGRSGETIGNGTAVNRGSVMKGSVPGCMGAMDTTGAWGSVGSGAKVGICEGKGGTGMGDGASVVGTSVGTVGSSGGAVVTTGRKGWSSSVSCGVSIGSSAVILAEGM